MFEGTLNHKITLHSNGAIAHFPRVMESTSVITNSSLKELRKVSNLIIFQVEEYVV